MNRANGLDTLRAVAIVLVFMYHYMVFVSHEATFGWASEIGWAGVDLFFVLSGYLIGDQIFRGLGRGQRLSVKVFYARRFLRTLPNYYVVLAFYFLLPALMGGKAPPPLWRFLTFTQNLGLKPGTAFSHAWSLCIEEQFYLLLPLVALAATRVRGSLRLAWIFLAGLTLAAITLRSVLWFQYGREDFGSISSYYPNVYYSSLCRFDEFLPGVAIALLRNFHRAAWERLTQWGNGILAAGTLAVAGIAFLALRYYYVDGYGYGFFMSGFGYSLLSVCFAILVLAALSPASLLYRIRVPGAARLAAWSYAIYLSHKPLAFITQNLLHGSAGAGALLAIVSCVCVAGGWLLYRLVETPFMKFRSRRFPTNFPAAPAAQSAQALIQPAR